MTVEEKLHLLATIHNQLALVGEEAAPIQAAIVELIQTLAPESENASIDEFLWTGDPRDIQAMISDGLPEKLFFMMRGPEECVFHNDRDMERLFALCGASPEDIEPVVAEYREQTGNSVSIEEHPWEIVEEERGLKIYFPTGILIILREEYEKLLRSR